MCKNQRVKHFPNPLYCIHLGSCTTHQHNEYSYSRWFGVTKMPSPSLTCTVLSSLVTETTLFQHSALLLDFMPTFSYMTLSRLHEPNNTRVNSSSTEAEKQHWEIFGYPEMNESKKISLSDWHNAHALTADWATEWENCIGQEKETLVVVFFPLSIAQLDPLSLSGRKLPSGKHTKGKSWQMADAMCRAKMLKFRFSAHSLHHIHSHNPSLFYFLSLAVFFTSLPWQKQ